MTRLLIITTNFPRYKGDPHSPWLVELLGLLRERGIQTEVLAPAFRGLRSHEIHGMRVHRFRYGPPSWEILTHEEGAPNKVRVTPLYFLQLSLYLLSGIVAACRVARRGEYDVIHTHWPIPQGVLGIFARLSCGWKRKPRLVATFYGADLVLVRRFKLLRPILRWIVRRCDEVAAISSYTRRELIAMAGGSPRTIPYGVAVPDDSENEASGTLKILFVGRLIPRKGVLYLIRAMALVEGHPLAHLVIVGDGPEREALTEEVRTLGLEGRVSFAGRVSDVELDQHYRDCYVFVLPAIVDAAGDTEMLGMVLLEAMRYRKPVIASNVGGIPDIVRDGVNGVLVPQRDSRALATAVTRLLEERSLARELGESARKDVQERFSWSAVVRETLAMYGISE